MAEAIALTSCPRCGWRADAMTPREAAEFLGVSHQTVRNWLREGRFPGAVSETSARVPGGRNRYLIPREDLERVKTDVA